MQNHYLSFESPTWWHNLAAQVCSSDTSYRLLSNSGHQFVNLFTSCIDYRWNASVNVWGWRCVAHTGNIHHCTPNSISYGVAEFQEKSDAINSDTLAFWFFISIRVVRNSVLSPLFHLVRNCVVERVYSHFADRALYKTNFPWRSACIFSFCTMRIFTPWTRRIIAWVPQCKFTRFVNSNVNFSDYSGSLKNSLVSYSNFSGGVFAPSKMQTTIFFLPGTVTILFVSAQKCWL